MVFATSSLHSLTHLCPQMFSALFLRARFLSRIDVERINSCLLAFAQRSLSPLQRGLSFIFPLSSFFFFFFPFNSNLIDLLMFINYLCEKIFFFLFKRVKGCSIVLLHVFSSKEHCSHLWKYFRTIDFNILHYVSSFFSFNNDVSLER